jgi:hypothetical protein
LGFSTNCGPWAGVLSLHPTHDPTRPDIGVPVPWLLFSTRTRPRDRASEFFFLHRKKGRKFFSAPSFSAAPHESMEIRAPPTSLRLAPPPASVSLRRTALRTSFLKGSGASLEFLSHSPVYYLRACGRGSEVRLLAGDWIRAR